MSVSDLCNQFNKTLRVPIEPEKYHEALDEIFNGREEFVASDILEKEETVITRAYQDHQASRKYLAELIKNDISFSLSLFEKLSTSSIQVLIGIFNDKNDTVPLLKEIEYEIQHSDNDEKSHFLLSCILQLLNSFEYRFTDLKWLIRTLCLRFNNNEIRSMGLVIFYQLETKFHSEFEATLLSFIDGLIIEADVEIGDDPLALIINILTELYPAFTTFCSSIILGNDLDRMLQQRAMNRGNDTPFLKSLFKLLIVSCIDETVRNNIATNYLNIIEDAMQSPSFEVYCALILIKTWSFSKLKNVTIHDLTTILVDTFINNSSELESDEFSYAIEGLAYLSLRTSVKLILRHHNFFIPKVIEFVKEKKFQDQNLYGILIILANLGSPPNDPNQMGKNSLRALESYANLQNPNSMNDEDIKDDLSSIKKFNQLYILKSELLCNLKNNLSELSQGSQEQVIRIIYNITRDTENIPKSVQQGYTILILEFLISANKTKKMANLMIRVLALRSLTKILIHTDPKLIFNKFSSLNTLPYLFEMLPSSDFSIQNETHLLNEDYLTTTDQYEALLALTNLASSPYTDGEDMCKVIGGNSKYWNVLETMMLDENPILQRADLELISNLMTHPLSIAVKFFNFENKQSKRNFDILVKLLLLDDIKSQRAVAAIFATIANMVPFVTQELLKQESLIKNAITALKEQANDIELVRRLIMLFYALFELAPEQNSQSFNDFNKIIKLPEINQLNQDLSLLLSQYQQQIRSNDNAAVLMDDGEASNPTTEDIEIIKTILQKINK
ncbi:hypothetical protein RI543_003021 [Arxiozyma heterogenica]|uniref:UNC-45/Cro1/She4 central domain-containing protein n=1 Tax=Arxiozyma heterogenica TaxID=278026 RepID=A0AAN7W1H8_9SACH|nr:hypothetical protein RI543_003021 [Kazachstania heterogenica]